LESVVVNAITFSDPQITKEDKDWLYPQISKAIKQVLQISIILVFSTTTLSNLVNYRE
jgi:hypothetical protein